MIASIESPSPKFRNTAPAWHAAFLAMLPAIRRQAHFTFRKFRREQRDDLVEEAIANSCAAFARLVELDKADQAFPSALTRFAAAQVFAGRRVGSRLRIGDVLSGFAQHKKGFVVESLDHFDEESNAWREILIEDKRATPAEIACCRLDFSAWLRLLPKCRRKIALTLAAGESTKATAKKFNVSPGRISQIRLWLKESWLRFQGEGGTDERPQMAVA